jgi:hypothetical protein
MDEVWRVLPLLLLSIPLAIGNYFLAGRLGRNRLTWVVLSLIPFVNIFFLYYVGYAVIFRLLDTLAAVAARLGAPTTAR